MTHRRTLILIIELIFSVSTFSVGQTSDSRLQIIEKELLQQDFNAIKIHLENTHPALYRYKNKQEISALMDSCYQSISYPMTGIEFYKQVKFVLSAIQDGHLSSDIPAELINYIEEKAKVFPLKLRFNKDKVYIHCNKDNSIQLGSEVLAINDEPIEKTRQILYQYIVSDGSIKTNKAWVLSNSFWFYYLMVYGEKPSFSIQYKNNSGDIETRDLPSTLRKNIDCELNHPGNDKKLRLSFKSYSTALLTIKTFSHQELNENNENFTTFLKIAFKEIKNKKIKYLIIDLRGNQGGRDVYGSLLYSYLTDIPFAYYKTLTTIDKALSIADHPNLGIQKPSENNFNGKVYFLIDGLSFSTAAEFCAIAKSNNRGTFIGEETGGGYYGNNGGHFNDVLLPNTKITVYIPATKYVMDVKKAQVRDRGIIPDFEVEPTVIDLVQNRDAQLNFALKLIDEKNSRKH